VPAAGRLRLRLHWKQLGSFHQIERLTVRGHWRRRTWVVSREFCIQELARNAEDRLTSRAKPSFTYWSDHSAGARFKHDMPGGPAGRTVQQARTGHQPPDRQDARSYSAPSTARPRRRGDRIGPQMGNRPAAC